MQRRLSPLGIDIGAESLGGLDFGDNRVDRIELDMDRLPRRRPEALGVPGFRNEFDLPNQVLQIEALRWGYV